MGTKAHAPTPPHAPVHHNAQPKSMNVVNKCLAEHWGVEIDVLGGIGIKKLLCAKRSIIC